MAENVARERIVQAASQATQAGWQAPVPFNIVSYWNDALAELYRLLEWAGGVEAIETTRGKRRRARKIAWRIQNALRELGEEPSVIAAARDFGVAALRGSVSELEAAVMNCAARRRAEVALGGVALPTQRRAALLVNAMDRLEIGMAGLGVTPVGRAIERATRSRDVRDRDGRGEQRPEPAPPQKRANERVRRDGWDEER